MENTSQPTDDTSSSLIKINRIINENLQKTWRYQAHVKYLKIECENLDKELKDLEPKIEAEMQTCKSLKDNLGRASKIKESEMQAIDTATKTHPQLVQRKIDEENKLKEWTDKFELTFDEHQKKFKHFKKDTEARNPLLRELRAANTEINKLEFDKKFFLEKIKNAKRAYELKKEIYRKIFYATIVKFVRAVSKYYYRESVINQLRENGVLMEKQHEQYKRKYLEKEHKRILNNISNRIEIPTLNLQLVNNLMDGTYQSILPEISSRSSRQNFEMPKADVSNMLTKYKRRSDERIGMTRKIEEFRAKSNCNETQKNIQGSKRPFEGAQTMKQLKKSFKPQNSRTAKTEICEQTKPPGIIKKNVENESVKQRITSSQNRVTKQVAFDMKERSSANDKTITSDKSQEILAQSQSDKVKLTPNTENETSTNFNFMLNSQGSQTQQKNTKQIVKAQIKEDLKLPTVMSSFGFISHDKNIKANTQPEQKNVRNKYAENPEKNTSVSKSPHFSAVVDEIDEFSPYFKKSESSRQPDNTNANEEEEKTNNLTNTNTDMTEYEPEQYLSYEFLTPQEDELNYTPNITFLREDQQIDSSGEDQNGFLFNLGQPSSQSSFKPFSFFN